QAYAQHGLAYYPKLVLGVPFTPAGVQALLLPSLRNPQQRLLT
ncbi:MAG TPA: peptidogalycan biosysnthesis protein, partial [Blastocatellia bacterium]|nr:peptidogalycan biosysnthesis protein [Blastocatellia bacterium]